MKRIAVALALLAGLWLLVSDNDSETRAPDAAHVQDGHSQLVFDRVWVSTLPEQPKQKIDYFIALRDQGSFGVFGRTSAYEGQFSAFEYRVRSGNKLTVKILQTDKKSDVKYRVKTEGCEPFDYCLQLKGAPKGGKKYYSMEDWEIEGAADVDSTIAAMRARLF